MKYSVGDIVYVRRDLSLSDFRIAFSMLKYKGVKTTVVKVHNGNWYSLECDGGKYGWVEDMLDHIREDRRKKLEKLYENEVLNVKMKF